MEAATREGELYVLQVGDGVGRESRGNYYGVVRKINHKARVSVVEWQEPTQRISREPTSDLFFIPTPKQIATACAEIQAGWSRFEERQRNQYKTKPVCLRQWSGEPNACNADQETQVISVKPVTQGNFK